MPGTIPTAVTSGLEYLAQLASRVQRVRPGQLSRPQVSELRQLGRERYYPMVLKLEEKAQELRLKALKAGSNEKMEELYRQADMAEYAAKRYQMMDNSVSELARNAGKFGDKDMVSFILRGDEGRPVGIANTYPPGYIPEDPLLGEGAYLSQLAATGEVPGTGRVLLRASAMENPSLPMSWQSKDLADTIDFYKSRGATLVPDEVKSQSYLRGELPVFTIPEGRLIKRAEGGRAEMDHGVRQAEFDKRQKGMLEGAKQLRDIGIGTANLGLGLVGGPAGRAIVGAQLMSEAGDAEAASLPGVLSRLGAKWRPVVQRLFAEAPATQAFSDDAIAGALRSGQRLVPIRPDEFHSASFPMDSTDDLGAVQALREHVRRQTLENIPALNVSHLGELGKFVVDHDGRHRMQAIAEEFGPYTKAPMIVQPTGKRLQRGHYRSQQALEAADMDTSSNKAHRNFDFDRYGGVDLKPEDVIRGAVPAAKTTNFPPRFRVDYAQGGAVTSPSWDTFFAGA